MKGRAFLLHERNRRWVNVQKPGVASPAARRPATLFLWLRFFRTRIRSGIFTKRIFHFIA